MYSGAMKYAKCREYSEENLASMLRATVRVDLDEYDMNTLKRMSNRWDMEEETGCWVWRPPLHNTGYSQITVRRKKTSGHRAAYMLLKGEIPHDMVIDHLCRTRACVNPEHMELVTNKENLLRGEGFSAVNAKKTHCPQGHSYSEENTYMLRGYRNCRTCMRERRPLKNPRAVRVNGLKTHCLRGHTYSETKAGARYCKTCQRERYLRLKEAVDENI